MGKKSKNEISTVNVIETTHGLPDRLLAFKNTKAGRKEASDTFKRLIRELEDRLDGAELTEPDLDCYVHEGVYSEKMGNEIYIVQSN